MVDTEEQASVDAPQHMVLDPFAFLVGVESRIRGLGGAEPRGDPQYAFHTPYVEAAPGPASFTLRFSGLKARQGTLQLWVNMLPMEPGARARVANSDRVKLNRVVQHGGETSIKFEGFRGVSFALHGTIVDETDAEAQALSVVLDRPAGVSGTAAAVEAKSSAFGRDAVGQTSRILSLEPPTFAAPVSQMCTAPQISAPEFKNWVKILGLGNCDPVRQWQGAFSAQVFQRYGMLEQGARALCVGGNGSPFPAMLTAEGLEVVAAEVAQTSSGSFGVASGTDGENGATGAGAGGGASTQQWMDVTNLPGDFVNFDLLWTNDVAADFGSVKAGSNFIEASISCLRPGGLAVHLLPFDPRSRATYGEDHGAHFSRRDLERLALILISRNYQVAQIKIKSPKVLLKDDGFEPTVTSFGLIIRRPPSAY